MLKLKMYKEIKINLYETFIYSYTIGEDADIHL